MRANRCLVSLIPSLLILSVVAGEDPQPIPIATIERDTPVDFQKEVLPFLRRSCLACHNKTKARGDVVLETPASIAEGVEGDPLVVAGKGAESLLLQVAAHMEEPVMPPEDNKVGATPLTSEELAILKLWIDQGATGEVVDEAESAQWQPLPAHLRAIYAVALTDDGQLAACGRANQVFITHLPTRRELTRLTDPSIIERGIYERPGVAHLDSVNAIDFSPRGDLLATGGFRTVKIWRRPGASRVSELEAVAVEGAENRITAIATSADGAWLALGTTAGVVEIVRRDGDAKREVGSRHGARIVGLAFVGDGGRIASASSDGAIHIWKTESGDADGRIAAPEGTRAMARVGERLVTGGQDGVLRAWNVPADASAQPGEPASTVAAGTAPITALAAIPGSEQVVSGGEDGIVRLIDVAGGKQVREIGHGSPIVAVAARPDGQRLASVAADGSAKLWNAGDGKLVAELRGDYRARLEETTRERLAGLYNNRLEAAKKAFEAAEKDAKAKEEAAKKASDALAAAVTAVGEKKTAAEAAAEKVKSLEQSAAALATAAKEATENKAEAEAAAKKAAEELAAAKKQVEEAGKALKAAEDARGKAEKASTDAAEAHGRSSEALERALADRTTAEKAVEAPRAALEQAKKAVAEAMSPMAAVAFSTDGLRVACGGAGRLTVWSAEDGTAFEVAELADGGVAALAFVSDTLALAANQSRALLLDVNPTWTLERTIGGPDDASTFADRITALDFGPEGRLLAIGGGLPSRTGELHLWDVVDGAPRWSLPEAHSDAVFSVEISSTGDHVASCGADKLVKVFSTADGALIRSLEGHTHHVLGVSWRFDEQVLASCGADNAIRLWTFPAGDRGRTIGGFGKQVSAVEFVGDSQNTISCSGDRSVRLHRTDNGGTVRNFGGAQSYMYAVDVTPDGKIVAAGGFDGVLRVWEGESGKTIHNFEPPGAETK